MSWWAFRPPSHVCAKLRNRREDVVASSGSTCVSWHPRQDWSFVIEPLEVVGAVIVQNRTVYCTQRGSGALAGKWEFPGGKLEAGESPQQALAREIDEELNCQVDVGDRILTTRHEYAFATVILTTYYCALRSGTPSLSEHQQDAWLPPEGLTSLDWAPADIPAVQQIQKDYL